MTPSTIVAVAIAAPLAGALVNGLFGRRLPRAIACGIGLLCPLVSAAAAVEAFLHVHAQGEFTVALLRWIEVGPLSVPLAFTVDHLSAVMFLVVTLVGWLIHVYSTGYMEGDPGWARYFAYLNLFVAAMLVLVLADNLAVMFVGWEGVGLCSYLLIGFWFHEEERAAAGLKAFVVNRIGDLGFLLGIFLAWTAFGTLAFGGMKAALPRAAEWVAPVTALLLFVGAMGKSAQIPLYVWLPDAMAGPTPVSALIHAATMVTAGVYMMCRMSFLYDAAPGVQEFVAGIAAATALLAAVIACGQWNLKKVLAYSTISQLAYMFAGAAAGAYAAAMFHLVTHAFFKALLFLASGAVIHALHGEEDMRRMGALGRPLAGVAVLFAVGALAMGGPLSGFFSKEEILAAVHARAWTPVWAILIATGALTAFYIARAFLLTFAVPAGADHHDLHKPGVNMMAPMAVLAVASAAGMALGTPLAEWLRHPAGHPEAGPTLPLSLAGMLGGYAVAFVTCVAIRPRFVSWTESVAFLRFLRRLVEHKFYVDEAYHDFVVVPVRMAAAGLWLVVDRWVVDGVLVGGWAWLARRTGGAMRRASWGTVNALVAGLLAGLVLLFAAWRALHG